MLTTNRSNSYLGKVIEIDEARIEGHFGEIVRGTVEETLNAMLDAEADRICVVRDETLAKQLQDFRSSQLSPSRV